MVVKHNLQNDVQSCSERLKAATALLKRYVGDTCSYIAVIGLCHRACTRGKYFSPATMRMIPNFFHRKQEENKTKGIFFSCLIFHIRITYTQQLNILGTALLGRCCVRLHCGTALVTIPLSLHGYQFLGRAERNVG